MRVFITGVAGFMGSHLADKLIANGEDVVGVDNLVGGTLDNVNPQVEFYEEDCDNLEKMTEYMKGCDVVFHAACTAHDGFSLFSPYYITKNTFQITMSVLSAAVQNNVSKFIYCSSMSRYGEQEKLPFTEDISWMRSSLRKARSLRMNSISIPFSSAMRCAFCRICSVRG